MHAGGTTIFINSITIEFMTPFRFMLLITSHEDGLTCTAIYIFTERIRDTYIQYATT